MSIVNMNLTESMAPADRFPYIRAYAETVDAALASGKISGPLTSRCTECGSVFIDADEAFEDTEHIIVTTVSDSFAVIVACEGYFTVDPNTVGFESRNWQNWLEDQDMINGDFSNI